MHHASTRPCSLHAPKGHWLTSRRDRGSDIKWQRHQMGTMNPSGHLIIALRVKYKVRLSLFIGFANVAWRKRIQGLAVVENRRSHVDCCLLGSTTRTQCFLRDSAWVTGWHFPRARLTLPCSLHFKLGRRLFSKIYLPRSTAARYQRVCAKSQRWLCRRNCSRTKVTNRSFVSKWALSLYVFSSQTLTYLNQ